MVRACRSGMSRAELSDYLDHQYSYLEPLTYNHTQFGRTISDMHQAVIESIAPMYWKALYIVEMKFYDVCCQIRDIADPLQA